MLFKEIIAVYSENHAKSINTKFSITECQSRWFIYLPLGLEELIAVQIAKLKSLFDMRLKRKHYSNGDIWGPTS
jgi:hypothetical protein